MHPLLRKAQTLGRRSVAAAHGRRKLGPLSLRDDMLDTADHYERAGADALGIVKEAMAATGVSDVRRILDLPCGHGRVMRHLRSAWPEVEIVASDLDEHGVAFCARHFGATPVVSTPTGPRLDGAFDVIWVGSLLTHLELESWRVFLRLFAEHLASPGVLVFTTHGPQRLEELRPLLPPAEWDRMGAAFRSDGFGYGSYKGGAYGLTISTPEVVRREVEAAGLTQVAYQPDRWDGWQDVVVATR